MFAYETRKLKSQRIIISSGEGIVLIFESSLLKFFKITVICSFSGMVVIERAYCLRVKKSFVFHIVT